eukprot:3193176-Lingulodinium_polyedra.AAC.1
MKKYNSGHYGYDILEFDKGERSMPNRRRIAEQRNRDGNPFRLKHGRKAEDPPRHGVVAKEQALLTPNRGEI